MDRERSKMHGSRDTVPSRNYAISRSTEMVSDLVIRKTGGGSTADMEKEKCGERSLVSNSVVPGPDRRKVLGARTLASTSLATAQRRKDVLGMPVENLSSIHEKTEIHIHQKVEKKNKTQVKKAEDKDKITKEKKKEENILENAEARVANKFRNYGKKDQVDTLNCKPLAPHKDNAIGTECVDGTMKKRKNLDTNGYIKENDERPGKIPRLWELHLTAPSSISLRPDRLLENKERLINGNAISKYLSQIYTVPKMVELPELDDQEWLFNLHDSLQKSKTELKADKIPQLFAQAMRIDSADILALPYVVPF
ncbi:uncharacterized protein LOC110103052 [Dendrobium catenatum]|uniref:uncharacterized protein LOC110103052 n=1 Tax=Dendrobium catenatum TaxID=906689 RepID=UPI00109F3CA9|nr:uncharacterized protein LOC110103052 [Dendrobium catenatum]